jgi:hypothetical protein
VLLCSADDLHSASLQPSGELKERPQSGIAVVFHLESPLSLRHSPRSCASCSVCFLCRQAPIDKGSSNGRRFHSLVSDSPLFLTTAVEGEFDLMLKQSQKRFDAGSL